jgi:hypothetical protein
MGSTCRRTQSIFWQKIVILHLTKRNCTPRFRLAFQRTIGSQSWILYFQLLSFNLFYFQSSFWNSYYLFSFWTVAIISFSNLSSVFLIPSRSMQALLPDNKSWSSASMSLHLQGDVSNPLGFVYIDLYAKGRAVAVGGQGSVATSFPWQRPSRSQLLHAADFKAPLTKSKAKTPVHWIDLRWHEVKKCLLVDPREQFIDTNLEIYVKKDNN